MEIVIKMKFLLKILIFSLLLLIFHSCNAQKKLDEYQLRKIKERDLFIKNISDTLNLYHDKDCELPIFFLFVEYDRLIGSKYWLSMHATISIRKLIIDNITNRHLLNCVVNSENQEIKKHIPIPTNASFTYNRIPYQEYSTFELVKLRIEELENIQKKGLGNVPQH